MNRKLIIVGTIAILAFGATYIWGATYIFLGSAPNSAPGPSQGCSTHCTESQMQHDSTF